MDQILVDQVTSRANGAVCSGCCKGPPGTIPSGTTVLQGLQSLGAWVVFARSEDQGPPASDGIDAIVVVVASGLSAWDGRRIWRCLRPGAQWFNMV